MFKKALYDFEIFRALKGDPYSKPVFKAVVPIDKIPLKIMYPSAYVINTDSSTGSGEHWLAVYYDKEGQCGFFDSYGMEPRFYGLEKYLNNTSHNWIFNNIQLQSLTSITCGYYCIYFIQMMCRDFSMTEIVEHFSNEDFLKNDLKISHVCP